MMKDVGMSLKSQLLASLVGLFVKLNTSRCHVWIQFFHCSQTLWLVIRVRKGWNIRSWLVHGFVSNVTCTPVLIPYCTLCLTWVDCCSSYRGWPSEPLPSGLCFPPSVIRLYYPYAVHSWVGRICSTQARAANHKIPSSWVSALKQSLKYVVPICFPRWFYQRLPSLFVFFRLN